MIIIAAYNSNNNNNYLYIYLLFFTKGKFNTFHICQIMLVVSVSSVCCIVFNGHSMLTIPFLVL